MKIVLITGFVDPKFQYREELYFKRLENRFEMYLLSSYVSPPQKHQKYKVTNLIGKNHFRFIHLFHFKDIIILPLYRKLKKIKPDIIHLFDAQQLVGVIPLLYCLVTKTPLIYEHELKIYPTTFFGKLRYILLTKPITKVICIYAHIIRVVTPAGQNLLLDMFKNNEKVKQKIINKSILSTLFYSDEIQKNHNIYYGTKNFNRILKLCFSGKIDNIKFNNLCIFLSKVNINITNIELKFMMDLDNSQNLYISNLLLSKKIKFKIVGLLNKDQYYNELINSDAMLFVNPSISFFEAIGCNLPIFIEKNQFTSHLESSNIYKYSLSNLQNDFDCFIDYCRKFNYSSDPNFSESNIIDNLTSQYKKIYDTTRK